MMLFCKACQEVEKLSENNGYCHEMHQGSNFLFPGARQADLPTRRLTLHIREAFANSVLLDLTIHAAPRIRKFSDSFSQNIYVVSSNPDTQSSRLQKPFFAFVAQGPRHTASIVPIRLILSKHMITFLPTATEGVEPEAHRARPL